jgi:hypothetical protein
MIMIIIIIIIIIIPYECLPAENSLNGLAFLNKYKNLNQGLKQEFK